MYTNHTKVYYLSYVFVRVLIYKWPGPVFLNLCSMEDLYSVRVQKFFAIICPTLGARKLTGLYLMNYQ